MSNQIGVSAKIDFLSRDFAPNGEGYYYRIDDGEWTGPLAAPTEAEAAEEVTKILTDLFMKKIVSNLGL